LAVLKPVFGEFAGVFQSARPIFTKPPFVIKEIKRYWTINVHVLLWDFSETEKFTIFLLSYNGVKADKP